ncbi:MAG: ROK family protein [Ilumatobacteraceae bacterium]
MVQLITQPEAAATGMSVKPIPSGPVTLAIDIGGTGLKASILDADGKMLNDRVRVKTKYPCPPTAMVERLVALTEPLGGYDRVSVGFPGVVRRGLVLSAPHFVTTNGPGTHASKKLAAAWGRFDLAGGLAAALGKPTKLINDADMQGLEVMQGSGVELIITLGTGMGNSVFQDGRLGPRLELSHHPLLKGLTYNEYVGDAARKEIGNKHWNKRVRKTLAVLDALFFYDRLYIGGGNSTRLKIDLDERATIIDPNAGILGGIRLWDPSNAEL